MTTQRHCEINWQSEMQIETDYISTELAKYVS